MHEKGKGENCRKEWLEENFVKIEASKFSLEDEFLKHESVSINTVNFYNKLIKIIKNGMLDFYVPKMDPSLDKNGNICYKKGERPAVGKPSIWWEKESKKVAPEYNSKIGNENQYIAFIGMLVKNGIITWEQAAEESKDVGHYCDSEDAKHCLEETGSRPIDKFFDLGNTCKIVKSEVRKFGYALAGGHFEINSSEYPLVDMENIRYRETDIVKGVGWITLNEN